MDGILNELAKHEIDLLREDYINERIKIEEFELGVDFWIKWSEADFIGKRNLEMEYSKEWIKYV